MSCRGVTNESNKYRTSGIIHRDWQQTKNVTALAVSVGVTFEVMLVAAGVLVPERQEPNAVVLVSVSTSAGKGDGSSK